MVGIQEILANKKNYGGKRTSAIKYIVIHYTANDGDRDESNGNYFKNKVVGASAHYFVDSNSITRSVPEANVAWSVGGNKYNNNGGKLYKKCTNNNSISIELCDDVKNGVVYPSAKTIENALDLVEYLMKKYSVPKENVIRHYDVNGKPCPKYWTDDAKWKSEFWNKIGGSGTTKVEPKPTAFKPYTIKITCSALNIRSGVGTGYKVTGVIRDKKAYTIVEERNGWGRLKSGTGWIKLSYTKKV